MEAGLLKSLKTAIFFSSVALSACGWIPAGPQGRSTPTAMVEDTKGSLETLKQELNKYGPPKIEGTDKAADKTVPGLFFGTKKINNNYDVVVLKADGTRAIGTTLAHNKAYDAVKKGETFCGEVEILGSPYDTCYEPIKEGANIIGIYYVGYMK